MVSADCWVAGLQRTEAEWAEIDGGGQINTPAPALGRAAESDTDHLRGFRDPDRSCEDNQEQTRGWLMTRGVSLPAGTWSLTPARGNCEYLDIQTPRKYPYILTCSYFINHYTKTTSWEDPRDRYQQIGKAGTKVWVEYFTGMVQGVSFSGEGEQGARSNDWPPREFLPGPAGQPASGLYEEGARGRAGEQRPTQVQQSRGQIWRPSDGIRPGARWVI